MTTDSDLHDGRALSAVALGRELARRGTPVWTLWLGYLSLGGTMTLPELGDTLAGTRPTGSAELYLLAQSLNA
jgi:hypothetical protein